MFQRILGSFSKSATPIPVERIRASKLTYLSREKLENIARCIDDVQGGKIPGIFVEYGVALGGSGIFIASHMNSSRKFVGFDLFGMIPPPGPKDDAKSHERYQVIASGQSRGIGGNPYYGYEPDLLAKVVNNFSGFGLQVDHRRISLVPGLFENTVDFAEQTKIAFAHIDCDWFDPVMLCLEKTFPHMPSGGFIVLDDYNDYGGCKKATDEFLARNNDVELVDASSNAILRKK